MARFSRHLEACRQNPGPDPVHDLRVSIRRLRALFRASRLACLKTVRPGSVKSLRGLMGMLSRFRDLQVQQVMLAPLASRFPCLEDYMARLRASEESARNLLSGRLSSFDEPLLAGEVEAMATRLGQVSEAGRCGGRAAGRISDHLAGAHRRLLSLRSAIESADPSAIHRLRVAFKKYRYLVEPLAPLSANPDPSALARMHDLQGAMGDIQDLAVLMRGLRSWAAAGDKRQECGPALRTLALSLEDKINGFRATVAQIDSFVFELGPGNRK
jgi:CHAD domain-containing protein